MSDKARVSTEEWDAWRSFIDMHRQLSLVLERDLQRTADISAADYAVLLTLRDGKDNQLRARELGSALAWEKSRVSHQVSRMEKRGLVERRDCTTDARGTWIGLTPSGRRAILGAMRDHSESLRKNFLDIVTPAELEALKSASSRVLGAIEPPECTGDEPNCSGE